LQRAYEELKVRMNCLAAKARKVPEDGWPGNNTRDHPAMIQVREYFPARKARKVQRSQPVTVF
jgi:hypothetical protein